MSDEIHELMKIDGNIKGDVIRSDLLYIKHKMGEEGLKKIEDKMEELGYPLRFEKIKPMDYYKEAQSVAIYLLLRDIFGWTEKDIEEMGTGAAKTSFIVKAFLKYFVSISRLMQEAPEYWNKHNDFGKLETREINEEKKYIVFQIKDYHFHPLACAYHKGYFLTIARFAIKGKNILITKEKCTHEGDDCHQYRITWE